MKNHKHAWKRHLALANDVLPDRVPESQEDFDSVREWVAVASEKLSGAVTAHLNNVQDAGLMEDEKLIMTQAIRDGLVLIKQAAVILSALEQDLSTKH